MIEIGYTTEFLTGSLYVGRADRPDNPEKGDDDPPDAISGE